MTPADINLLIKENKIDTNFVSDGFHTFGELYEHRITIFIALCRKMKRVAWKTKLHDDGVEWQGWFILGLFTKAGKQISYHLPISKWDLLDDIKTLERAPKWDGHTSEDVLKRLAEL